MAKSYKDQIARKKQIRRKNLMTYRVFKWSNATQTYRLIPGREDVTLATVGIRWTAAAMMWVQKYAEPDESEIHLMVARFSTRIEECKLITLKREPNPWVVAQAWNHEDEDEGFEGL
jgi:hypothetical protein